LNAFSTRLRQGGGDLGGGRTVGRHRERVEGREVQRVGDVHDDLAGEGLPAALQDLGDGRVGDGQDDDVAGDLLLGAGRADQLDAVAAPAGDRRDGLAHVPGTDDADPCHETAPTPLV
jgi:hypothetical protein